MTVSESALRKFVDGALTVRLATVSRKGTPLLTPLWFARDGDVIYLGTRRGSPHARHITENPGVVMLFGDRNGKRTRRVLRVAGTARVCDIKGLSGIRKGGLHGAISWRPARSSTGSRTGARSACETAITQSGQTPRW